MNSKNSLFKYVAVATAMAAVPFAVKAQDNGDQEWNHFGLDFRMGLNIQTKFSHDAPPLPAAGGAVNRNYDDGFVDVDKSGNLGGATWNWGYKNSSQISGSTLFLNATGGPTLNDGSGPNPGFEASFARDLGHETWGAWGMKLALGYTRINVEDGQTETGQQITDGYNLGTITPPAAPYGGTFQGPGSLIGSTPISHSATPVIITGSRSLDATLGDLRLGPYINLPIANRLSLEFGAGLALGLMDSKFSFTESVGGVQVSGSNNRTDILPGAYVEAVLAYRICPSTSVFAGLQYQYLTDFTQSVGGRTAEIDMSTSYYATFGLQWHF